MSKFGIHIKVFSSLHKAQTPQSFVMPFLCNIDTLVTGSVNYIFQVLIVVNVNIKVFWDMMQHSFADRYQCFGGNYLLNYAYEIVIHKTLICAVMFLITGRTW
jgi:hypothetical protein